MWWILGVAALVAVAFTLRPRASVTRLVDQAVAAKDPGCLVEHLATVPEPSRPTNFDQAVRGLWDIYERRLAARLVHGAADLVAGATITQYWIRQIMEVEPEVSKEVFDDPFLERLYRPEVAARCGKMG